ncbi:MAG: MerR family transcriptional regulator [Nocardioides sp.]|nr:MerR family transcriptional regulator [Nocardioides sp.]
MTSHDRAHLLSIGEFSRMTFLSVKTLRHYHETGLLEPVRIDPSSGYRFYDVSQVATAQVIRRFRDLDLPIERLRAFLDAPDEGARNAVIVDHLDKMSGQLRETQATVDSLRQMLAEDGKAFPVSYRDEPALTTLAITDEVAAADVVGWWMDAFRDLHRAVRVSGATRVGPDGALFPTEFFTDEVGRLVAFVPVGAVPARLPARVTAYDVPASRLALTTFDGPPLDLDRAYGALGRWVVEQASASEGPVRERYLPTGDEDDLLAHTTEVCWPVTG